jgi:hypothetical protein
VLFLNVSAGIGILAMASPLLQEVFGGRLIGVDLGVQRTRHRAEGQIAAIAAGFTGLLSLFNIGGRFAVGFVLGLHRPQEYLFRVPDPGLRAVRIDPVDGASGQLALFVGFFCIILSMYGGGFSTVPAYLADLFGTQMVGAIHGRLLTAWAAAGVIGPILINYIREYQIAHGVPKAQAYDVTMYVLAGLVLLGLLLNTMIRPIADKHFMTDAELATEKKLAHERDIRLDRHPRHRRQPAA